MDTAIDELCEENAIVVFVLMPYANICKIPVDIRVSRSLIYDANGQRCK